MHDGPSDLSKFAIPHPVEYDPPSVFYRYWWLLVLFLVLFVTAMTVGYRLIRAERHRELPLAPVYYVDTEPASPVNSGIPAAPAH
jgi:hypothetical protein